MAEYADYCPISMGVEMLGDRWTPLVIRELMVGASGFNEIHRGLPRISRSLLSQRLRRLERHGLVTRASGGRGRQGRYALTPAGESLATVVWAMGHWAAEWRFGDPADDDLDGLGLIWRMHQHAVATQLPTRRVVLHVVLTGTGAAQGWLEVGPEGVTVCRDDPGLDVDLLLQADCRALHRWLAGLVDLPTLERDGQARLVGPSELTRRLPHWFDTSMFAVGLERAERRRASGLVSG